MTAYVTPHVFVNYGNPTVGAMNTFAINCDALVEEEVKRDYADNGLCTGVDRQNNMIHFHPWLFYVSESEEAPGTIRPWEGKLEDELALPYKSGDGGFYALEYNLQWMVVGALYEVQHVKLAWEVPEPWAVAPTP